MTLAAAAQPNPGPIDDGLFVVGAGPLEAGSAWPRGSQLEAGDVVDALMPDGRIVRTAIAGRRGDRVVLDVRDGTVRLDDRRVRRPLGWKDVPGCAYDRPVRPQKVPHTCPALDQLRRLAGALSYADRHQAWALIELVRAHNESLRALAAHPPRRPRMIPAAAALAGVILGLAIAHAPWLGPSTVGVPDLVDELRGLRELAAERGLDVYWLSMSGEPGHLRDDVIWWRGVIAGTNAAARLPPEAA